MNNYYFKGISLKAKDQEKDIVKTEEYDAKKPFSEENPYIEINAFDINKSDKTIVDILEKKSENRLTESALKRREEKRRNDSRD